MALYLVELDPTAEKLYRAVARSVSLPLERVLSDALFRLAGELSMEANAKAKPEK